MAIAYEWKHLRFTSLHTPDTLFPAVRKSNYRYDTQVSVIAWDKNLKKFRRVGISPVKVPREFYQVSSSRLEDTTILISTLYVQGVLCQDDISGIVSII